MATSILGSGWEGREVALARWRSRPRSRLSTLEDGEQTRGMDMGSMRTNSSEKHSHVVDAEASN